MAPLLAFALAAAPLSAPPAPVIVLPVAAGPGTVDSVQLAAIQRLAASAIERGTHGPVTLAPVLVPAEAEVCRDAACLARHSPNRQQVALVELVRFGETLTVTLYDWDPEAPANVRSATRTAAHIDEVPRALERAVEQVWPAVAPVEGASEAVTATETPAWTPTLALSPKVGNVFPGFNTAHLQLSAFNPRLDFEVDYYALPNFLTFVDASVVFASQTGGESVQLVPVLLGAKYLFREGSALRPYLGIGVGLGFLTGALNANSSTSASFTVYSVLGLAYFPWRQIGFTAESTVNLTGLEVTASSDVLFAISGDVGAVFVF